jgi:hypothetical protein
MRRSRSGSDPQVALGWIGRKCPASALDQGPHGAESGRSKISLHLRRAFGSRRSPRSRMSRREAIARKDSGSNGPNFSGPLDLVGEEGRILTNVGQKARSERVHPV